MIWKFTPSICNIFSFIYTEKIWILKSEIKNKVTFSKAASFRVLAEGGFFLGSDGRVAAETAKHIGWGKLWCVLAPHHDIRGGVILGLCPGAWMSAGVTLGAAGWDSSSAGQDRELTKLPCYLVYASGYISKLGLMSVLRFLHVWTRTLSACWVHVARLYYMQLVWTQ